MKAGMTDEEYAAAQQALILAANLLDQHDLAAFTGRIGHAEAVGFLHMVPRDYMRGIDRLRHIRTMAEAARKLVGAWTELRTEIVQQEANRVEAT